MHDNFAQMGGAERVAETLHTLLPEADVYTTLAARSRLSPKLQAATINTTWMQHLPMPEKFYRHYFLLYPFAVEGIDLSGYDLVVSSCFGYAKGVKTAEESTHVCYCHTPARWLWRQNDYLSRENFGRLKQKALAILLTGLKKWDERAARRPDYFIANSQVVAERIRDVYRREAVVIPPPIDVNRFSVGEKQEEHYLVLSRLAAYKRIDLAIEACTRLNRPLVVIGDGPDRGRLEKLAGKSVKFLGRQPDEVVQKYAQTCRALLFPGEEDFGMAPLEINAAGRPVIAFRAGGATETVLEGETGILFDEATVESLADAIVEFEPMSWNSASIRRHAESYDTSVFATRFYDFLSQVAPGFENQTLDKATRRESPARLAA